MMILQKSKAVHERFAFFKYIYKMKKKSSIISEYSKSN